MFQQLLGNIRRQVARTVFKVKVVEQRAQQQEPEQAPEGEAQKPEPEVVAPGGQPVLGNSSTPDPESLRTNRDGQPAKQGGGKSSKAAARRRMMR
ncbi:MAG: hypothetical protein U5Q44_05175 [Dehalococcoidia bacterium]|nr:hypothetical protein [Dehalococcoidia bacterium]